MGLYTTMFFFVAKGGLSGPRLMARKAHLFIVLSLKKREELIYDFFLEKGRFNTTIIIKFSQFQMRLKFKMSHEFGWVLLSTLGLILFNEI